MDAIEATYSSRCAVCDEAIEPSDMIVKTDDGDWVHEDCADEA